MRSGRGTLGYQRCGERDPQVPKIVGRGTLEYQRCREMDPWVPKMQGEGTSGTKDVGRGTLEYQRCGEMDPWVPKIQGEGPSGTEDAGRGTLRYQRCRERKGMDGADKRGAQVLQSAISCRSSISTPTLWPNRSPLQHWFDSRCSGGKEDVGNSSISLIFQLPIVSQPHPALLFTQTHEG